MDAVARPPAQRLAGLVREFRRRAGLTQQEAADLAGMSVAGLRDLEQGRVAAPRPATVRRLAAALELSVAETADLLRLARAGPAGHGLLIRVLGPLAVTVDGVPADLGSATQRTLLGLLALHPNTPVHRDVLIEAGWGDRPPAKAADLLQTHLSRLRRRLQPRAEHPGLLAATAGGYQLTVTADQLDLLAFTATLAAARRARTAGDLATAGDRYDQAAALWRGQPVEDVEALRLHPAAVALVRQWQAAVVEYAQTAELLGRHDRLLPLLERLVEADPLHEAAHARLMIALAGTGQQAAALTRYDQLRRRLAEDLGTDPGPDLLDAHRRVLRQEVTAGTAPPAAHRQLPPDIADFTGRRAELEALHERLAPAAAGTALVISAIEGMAGVGKTRLAVHLAHQLLAAGRYRDVQLYVDLRGHAAEPPADPATALAHFLHLLGIPANKIPPDLDARAALYRDRLHDRHALVLLDNAASGEQVQPLLPASPTNLVLITSRRALALDGAHDLPLDVFTAADAEALLVRIVGRQRFDADPAAARALVDLCGRLPLAIALAARRLQARPAWGFADLAARLEETGNRLGELTAGSRQLRAVFDLSYHALDDPSRRLFRLLGLHPGVDVDAGSAAALAGLAPADARRLLDRLVDEHLVAVAGGDRYRPHDLIREYARQVVAAAETEPERHAATTRLLDYYLHAAAVAAQLLQPNRWQPALVGTAPEHLPRLADADEAARWLATERVNLTAAVRLAAEQGWPAHAWRLANSLALFLYLYGFPEDWAQTVQVALAAAEAASDRDGAAVIHTYVGTAHLTQGRFEEAYENLSRVVELLDGGGDRTMLITALGNLGAICYRLGRLTEALRYTEAAVDLWTGQDPYREGVLRSNAGMLLATLGRVDEALATFAVALERCREAGDAYTISGVLANLGEAHRLLGRYPEAVDHIEQALSVATAADLRSAEANARHVLGRTYHDMGRLDDALACLTEALEVALSLGDGSSLNDPEVLTDVAAAHLDAGNLDRAGELAGEALRRAVAAGQRYEEARALDVLGRWHDRAGRAGAAREHWQRAYAMFTEFGTPGAAEVRRRLDLAVGTDAAAGTGNGAGTSAGTGAGTGADTGADTEAGTGAGRGAEAGR